MTALALAIRKPASAFRAVIDAAKIFFEGIAEGREIARRYEEMSRLSEAALAARGLTREELPQAIVTGRIRR